MQMANVIISILAPDQPHVFKSRSPFGSGFFRANYHLYFSFTKQKGPENIGIKLHSHSKVLEAA